MKKGNENTISADLTRREEMVMKCIWDHVGEEAISAVQIQKKLSEKYGIDYERSTITTFLLHLREKDFIESYKKGQIYYYTALVSGEEYIRDQTKQFVDFWVDGDVDKMNEALKKAGK